MIVGTTETAKILNISTARLRVLLIAGRVEGAYKTGRIWLIPRLGARSLAPVGDAGSHRCSRANQLLEKGKEVLPLVGVILESQLKLLFMTRAFPCAFRRRGVARQYPKN